MKHRDDWGPADELANAFVNSILILAAIFALLCAASWLERSGYAPWPTYREPELKALTRADVVCEPPNTIRIKPGTYLPPNTNIIEWCPVTDASAPITLSR